MNPNAGPELLSGMDALAVGRRLGAQTVADGDDPGRLPGSLQVGGA
jgi:hypothetical protein